MDNDALKENLSNGNQWMRVLYMLLFVVILYLVALIVGVVVIVQALFALLTGKPSDEVADFAKDLSRYVYAIVKFLTYTDDKRPFPFSDWAEAEVKDDEDSTGFIELTDDKQ
jgi:uncharacterized membrane protein